MTGLAREAARVALGHPRHVALMALVAGLLAGPASLTLGIAGAGALGAALLLAAALAPRDHPPPLWRPELVALAATVAAGGGAALAVARIEALDGGRMAAAEGRYVNVRAVLLEPLRRHSIGPVVARVRLAGAPLDGQVAVLRAPAGKLPPRWPRVGEIVEVGGRVAPLGRYDAYQRPRGANGAIDAVTVRSTGRRRGGLAGALDGFRRRAETGLDRGLRPADAALVRGMVLGEDERLGSDERTDFQRSGLAHLLAVSGQNVVLLATLVFALAAVVGLPLRARLVGALVLVGLYVPLTGGGPSIQRAGVMGAAGLVAALAGRPSSRWYALGLAAAVTLVLNPRTSADPGWQLSFAAVVSLLALAAPLRELLERRMPRVVAEAASITIAATIGTAPLIAVHFQQLSLVSLPANVLAAPLVAPIMWLGMLAGAAAQLSPALAAPLNALDGPLLAALAWLARAASAIPLAVLPVRIATPAALAAGTLVPAGLVLVLRWVRDALPPRGVRIPLRAGLRAALLGAGVAGVAGTVALAARAASPPFLAGPGQVVVSFLDVGQGDATLVQDGTGASVLFDGGPPEALVYRQLRRAGVRRLDLMVSTHQSRDHQGGLHDVLAHVPTRLMVENADGTRDPDYHRLLAEATARGVRQVVAAAGERFQVGGLSIQVLSPVPRPPSAGPPDDPNPRGVAAIVSEGGFDLWLSADAESDAILPLPLRPVEAMKVSHHGSSDPGLPEVLARLRPQVAAIEVGAHNTYGHPAPSTIAALRVVVPHVYRTDRDGTVRLTVDASGMRVETGG
ncbi:MAG: competence protein ComEC [Solirubrobacteraceae bacterium]|nr:competence protein ComEC [Solirubrobacteraceae bacterium]